MLGGQIGPQHPASLVQQLLPASQHIDGKHNGQHQGDEHGQDAAGDHHHLGGSRGHAGKHALQEAAQVAAQGAEIQRGQVQIIGDLVDNGLEIDHIAAYAGGKQLDAVHHLGQHKGEQGHDNGDHHQVRGEHRQRAAQLAILLPQVSLIVAAEKGTGPVEHKGDGKAQKQRPAAGEDLSHQIQDHVKLDHRQHQKYRIGNNQHHAAHPFAWHKKPLSPGPCPGICKTRYHYTMPALCRQHTLPFLSRQKNPQPRVCPRLGFPKGDACPFGYSGGQRDPQSLSVGKKAGRCEEGRLLFSRL